MPSSSNQTPPVQTSPADTGSSRDLGVLFTVSILLGLAGAIYELSLPLFLKREGLSWRTMGWIYSIAALATFVIRTFVGAWSDRVGRKSIYTGSLIATGLATVLTPCAAHPLAQTLLKCVTDPTSRVREAMHSVLLFETWPRRFQSLFSRTRGIEFLFHFVGLLALSFGIAALARRGMAAPHAALLAGSGILFLVAAILFAAGFRETAHRAPPRPVLHWRDFIRMDMPRPLWILTASTFVFTLAITISHCFVLQLYFQEKFAASDADIFMIGALHRLSPVIPLLFFGHRFQTRHRDWFMAFLIIEGIFIVLPTLVPSGTVSLAGQPIRLLWVAVLIWLGHDLFGMGLWMPIQQSLLQRFSRPHARGEDIGLSTALGALGAVPAPFLAGWLREWSALPETLALNLPFIVSGVGVALAAILLLGLPRDNPGT